MQFVAFSSTVIVGVCVWLRECASACMCVCVYASLVDQRKTAWEKSAIFFPTSVGHKKAIPRRIWQSCSSWPWPTFWSSKFDLRPFGYINIHPHLLPNRHQDSRLMRCPCGGINGRDWKTNNCSYRWTKWDHVQRISMAIQTDNALSFFHIFNNDIN